MNTIRLPGGNVAIAKDAKICPKSIIHDPLSKQTLYFKCTREECALWMGGMCAEKLQAKALDTIAKYIERREARGL